MYRAGIAGELAGSEKTVRTTAQGGLRARNERLVLTLVRQHGALAKAQIARMTGLSAQTVSVIMRALEAEGLLVKGAPVRGRVGQPSVPIGLAANGAFFLGLKIGRRSSELVLADFLGKVIARAHLAYRFPTPEGTIRFAQDAVAELTGQLPPADRARIAGLGVAMPFRIWDWAQAINLAPDAMAAWKEIDIRAELAAACGHPVSIENDASAACGAELVFGSGKTPPDFLYFYVGYFIGGGVVLADRLYTGRTGNAGALGSMPVPVPGGGVAQLIQRASLFRLEHALRDAGLDSRSLWTAPDRWQVPDALRAAWIAEAADGIAHAVVSAAAVLDVEAALVDGWMPARLRADLVAATRARIAAIDVAGLMPPEIREGTVGPDARALGAASLPLSERFLVERDAVGVPNQRTAANNS